MTFRFHKYHGTGNDFIIIDDRDEVFPVNDREAIARLCARHFGIGADGLILLRGNPGKWEMVYFNSDGRESTMCGNGGRCLVAFAHSFGLAEKDFEFQAIDGPHQAKVLEDGRIELGMKDVESFDVQGDVYVLDTGSPHYVSFRSGVNDLKVKKEGAAIRYSAPYRDQGINVNFVEEMGAREILVRTYERGVEDETLSCGTGVTASALAVMIKNNYSGASRVAISTPGGELSVKATWTGDRFTDVRLIGPAVKVFEGSLQV